MSANGKLLAVAGMLLNSDEPITTEYQMQTTELLLVRAGIVLDKITMLKREQQILMEKSLSICVRTFCVRYHTILELLLQA